MNECEKYGISHVVKYNAKKSAFMIFRLLALKGSSVSGIKLKRKYMFQMICHMMTVALIDNRELYMYKEMLYCEKLVCAPQR